MFCLLHCAMPGDNFARCVVYLSTCCPNGVRRRLASLVCKKAAKTKDSATKDCGREGEQEVGRLADRLAGWQTQLLIN